MENDRLIEIEIQLAHQQKTIDELNEVVTEQAREINSLKVKAKLLKETLNQQLVKNEEDETPPPHY